MGFRTDDPEIITNKKVRMDIAGQKFGKLTVVEYAFTNKYGQSMWKCKCDCGSERIVNGSHLANGHTTSCGCSRKGIARTHGMRHTRMYRVWLGMKARCTIATNPCFRHYGGRGIKVCDEWRNSFEAFHEWAMANGYEDHLTIDRIDVNGNYCPENCRWVTQKAQCRNKRDSIVITHNGETHNLKEWSEITGVNYYTMYSRYKAGATPSEIIRKAKAV